MDARKTRFILLALHDNLQATNYFSQYIELLEQQ